MSSLMTAGPSPSEDALTAHTRELRHAVAGIHRDAAARVSRDAIDPVRNAAAAAASAHAGALEVAGLADADSPPALPGRAIARYRAAVAQRVLAPLLGGLDALDPAAIAGAAWEEARARLHDLLETVPEELVGPEPVALHPSHPADPAGLRWRRTGVRLSRLARELSARAAARVRRTLGRPGPALPEPAQRVPLRALLRYHVEVRLPPLQGDLVEALAEQLARPAADLHDAIAAWTRAVLAAEIATDRAALHRLEDERVEPPAADATHHLDAVRQAADRLHATLEAIAAGPRLEQAAADELEAIVGEEEYFIADIEAAGTLLARRRSAAAAQHAEREARAIVRRLDLWSDWQRRTRAAHHVYASVLDTRAASHALVRDATADVLDAARALAARTAATARTLRAERADLERTCDACIAADDAGRLRAGLATVGAHVLAIIDDDAVAPLRDDPAVSRIAAAIDDRIAAFQSCIAALPDEVIVQSRKSLDAPPDPEAGSVRVRPRALIAESLDPLRLERIRAAAREVARTFEAALGDAAQCRSVIEYNLRAASADLEPPDDEPVDSGGLASARDLAMNGLDRAAESLERTAAEAAAAVRPFSDTIFQAVDSGWIAVLGRLRAEETVPEHALDVGNRVRARARVAAVRSVGGVRASLGSGRLGSRRTLPWFNRPNAPGPVAIDGEPATDADRRRTLEYLADLDGRISGLPVVYRRLFGVEASADRHVLEGRATEVLLRRQFRDWKAGLADPIVVTGWSGGGIAGLLDAAATLLEEEGCEVTRIAFEERVLDEAMLVARVADALHIEDAGLDALDALAGHILAAGDHPWPAVVFENLHQLMLRTAAGNGLPGAILSFLSATDARVFWIASCSPLGWSYIAAAEPVAAGLVRHLPLAPLSRDDLESAILARHARSGLPLTFEAPVAPDPALRRRLARAGGDDARQAILRKEFFDGLARAAGPDIVMALFYWLRGARLEDDGARLHMRPLEPLGFAFLDALGPDHAFALRAFLEHGTLSIAEHARVVSVPRAASRDMFASLANLQLIEPASPDSGTRPMPERDLIPWRLRSLVLQPVLELLRARNLAS